MEKLNVRALLAEVQKIPDPDAKYVYSRALLWDPGQSLRSCFVDGTDAEKNFVFQTANELLQGRNVNVSFNFGSLSSFKSCSGVGKRYDVRVSFSKGCCAAYVGKLAHHSDVRDYPTIYLQGVLNLDAKKSKQTVMHELIHALGFQHEHQSPSVLCESEFDKKAILTAYHWSEDDFKTNLKHLDKDSRSYRWSTYDELSIMKYFFEQKFLKKGEDSPCYSVENFSPSQRDYDGLRDAYPLGGMLLSKETVRSVIYSPASLGVSDELKALVKTIQVAPDGGN